LTPPGISSCWSALPISDLPASTIAWADPISSGLRTLVPSFTPLLCHHQLAWFYMVLYVWNPSASTQSSGDFLLVHLFSWWVIEEHASFLHLTKEAVTSHIVLL
jgi:hypothetical protein